MERNSKIHDLVWRRTVNDVDPQRTIVILGVNHESTNLLPTVRCIAVCTFTRVCPHDHMVRIPKNSGILREVLACHLSRIQVQLHCDPTQCLFSFRSVKSFLSVNLNGPNLSNEYGFTAKPWYPLVVLYKNTPICICRHRPPNNTAGHPHQATHQWRSMPDVGNCSTFLLRHGKGLQTGWKVPSMNISRAWETIPSSSMRTKPPHPLSHSYIDTPNQPNQESEPWFDRNANCRVLPFSCWL